MKSFLKVLFGSLATTSNNSSPSSPSSSSTIQPVQLEVCLSPGCIADGGEATLKKCMAIAPPDKVTVRKGGCVSACGNGPVARENDKIIHKRVTDVAIVPLLEELLAGVSEGEGEGEGKGEKTRTIPREVVEGYEIVLQAEEEAAASNFECAISSYERGIHLAVENSVDLDLKRIIESDGDSDSDSLFPIDDRFRVRLPPPPPTNFEWIIQAFCGLSKAKLRMKDYDGALTAAYKACHLSRGRDPTCWEVVAQICQECNNAPREMEALRNMFTLQEVLEGEDLPRDVANRRRMQGFRLAKLERDVSA